MERFPYALEYVWDEFRKMTDSELAETWRVLTSACICSHPGALYRFREWMGACGIRNATDAGFRGLPLLSAEMRKN